MRKMDKTLEKLLDDALKCAKACVKGTVEEDRYGHSVDYWLDKINCYANKKDMEVPERKLDQIQKLDSKRASDQYIRRPSYDFCGFGRRKKRYGPESW